MGYRIAGAIMIGLLATTWLASLYGWGLRSTAVSKAQIAQRRRDVRTGSGGYARGYYGGGPRYGK